MYFEKTCLPFSWFCMDVFCGHNTHVLLYAIFDYDIIVINAAITFATEKQICQQWVIADNISLYC